MPPGRLPLLSPAVQKAVCDAVALGCNQATAAEVAGVSPACLYAWLRKGRAGTDPDCVALLAALKRARAQKILYLLGKIKKAAEDPRHWTAAARHLQLTEPELYGEHSNELRELRGEQKRLTAMIEGILGGTLSDFAALQKQAAKLTAENRRLAKRVAETESQP